jgi:hypothetical protein
MTLVIPDKRNGILAEREKEFVYVTEQSRWQRVGCRGRA